MHADPLIGADAIDLRPIVEELGSLTTESIIDDRPDLDLMTTPELVAAMNAEDATVPAAVAACSDAIVRAVDAMAERLRRGGRLIYLGAGTAGRMGVLDASECPPTFGTPPELVVGLIAGGPGAMHVAVEGAEDDHQGASGDLADLGVSDADVVVGISASGRTPYVIGALEDADARGALTIAVAANAGSAIGQKAQIAIETVVGPEFVAGSTRLKAGTAQKLVLNMLSTLVMIRLGKTYHGVMVDLRATNAKLRARSIRTVAIVTGCDNEVAATALSAVDGSVKQAVLHVLTGIPPEETAKAIDDAGGMLRVAVERASSDRDGHAPHAGPPARDAG